MTCCGAHVSGLVSKRRERAIAEDAEEGYETEPALAEEEGTGTVGMSLHRQLRRCGAVMVV